MSSSWDKPRGRWVNVDELPKRKNTEEQPLDPWNTELQSSQERFRRTMAEIKRRVDEDPFKAIFGSRLQRSCVKWADLNRGLAEKADHGPEVVEGLPTKTSSQSNLKTQSGGETTAGKKVKAQKPDPVDNHQSMGPNTEVRGANTVFYMEPTVGKFVPESRRNQAISPSPAMDDFMIDPITLRKVPRIVTLPTQSRESDSEAKTGVVNIPVKKFSGYRAQPKEALEADPSRYDAPPAGAEGIAADQSSTDPVARRLEDYEHLVGKHPVDHTHSQFREASDQESVISPKHIIKTETLARDRASEPKPPPSYLESSLSRQLSSRARSGPTAKPQEIKGLHYTEKESTVEDIDLLRASDVRASSGLAGRIRRETSEEKQQRRKMLEDEFDQLATLNTQHAEEAAATAAIKGKRMSDDSGAKDSFSTLPRSLKESHVDDLTSPEPSTSKTDAFGYDVTPKGLETSYENELQTRVQDLENSYAADLEMHEDETRNAGLDGFDREAEGLETSFARERASQVVNDSPEEIASRHAIREAAHVDRYNEKTQPLLSSSAMDNLSVFGKEPQSQGIEPQGSVSHINKMGVSAKLQDSAGKGIEDAKTAYHVIVENPKPPCEETPAGKVLGEPQDVQHEGIGSKNEDTHLRMALGTDGNGAGVKSGLETYDTSLGPQAYTFHTGQDSLEADIIAQSANLAPKPVQAQNPTSYGVLTDDQSCFVDEGKMRCQGSKPRADCRAGTSLKWTGAGSQQGAGNDTC